jgi:hypothetical protein
MANLGGMTVESCGFQLLVRKMMTMPLIKQMMIGLGVMALWGQTTAVASAQPSTEAAVNQIFQSTVPLPGATKQQHQNRLNLQATLTQWLGAYQTVKKEDNHYLMIFEKGTLPIKMEFKPNGNPKSLSVVGCPVTSGPLSQAPRQYQQAISAYCKNKP